MCIIELIDKEINTVIISIFFMFKKLIRHIEDIKISHHTSRDGIHSVFVPFDLGYKVSVMQN